MQSKLQVTQIEKIKKAFHDHPLLVCCQQAFGRYEADFMELLFSPEEIFRESAIIIDVIKESPQDADAFLDNLWSSLKIKLRYWDKTTPQEDLDTATAFVLYVTAAALCLHWHSFYSEIIFGKLLAIVRDKTQLEEERIILELAKSSEELEKWINDYLSVDNGNFLSEEIDSALTQITKPRNAQKAVVKPLEKQQYAFIYNHPRGDLKNTKLMLLFKELIDLHWIAKDTDQQQFLDIFLGEKTQNKITWTTSVNMLRYLFNQWIDERKWLSTPSSVGKWQMVTARFYLRKRNGEVVELTENDLKNTADPADKKKEEAEPVIKLLDPALDFSRPLREN